MPDSPGTGSESRIPMGIAVISTFLTPVVVTAVYSSASTKGVKMAEAESIHIGETTIGRIRNIIKK
jgi:hypothetical protein